MCGDGSWTDARACVIVDEEENRNTSARYIGPADRPRPEAVFLEPRYSQTFNSNSN